MLVNLVTTPAAGFGCHCAQSMTRAGGRTTAKEVSCFLAALSHASGQSPLTAARTKMASAVGVGRTSKLCPLITTSGIAVSEGDI